MNKPIYGMMAEFDNPSALVNAARAAREEGYRKLDAYSPFPIEELSDALHLHKNKLPLLVLIGGIVGRSEEHTSELQSPCNLVCRLLLAKNMLSPSVVNPDGAAAAAGRGEDDPDSHEATTMPRRQASTELSHRRPCRRYNFFFNDTAPTEIYTLSLHDALPICPAARFPARWRCAGWWSPGTAVPDGPWRSARPGSALPARPAPRAHQHAPPRWLPRGLLTSPAPRP